MTLVFSIHKKNIMIESKYNFFVKDKETIICFNAINGSFFPIDISLYDFLAQLLSSQSIQEKEKNICETLNKLGFLVNSHEEEINYLRELNRKKVLTNDFHLIVNPTQNCTFKCWYCYENHIKSKMDASIAERIKIFITKSIKKKEINSFTLGWFGGEPLIYFNEIVYPISLHAQKEAERYKVKLINNMTTNGYLLTEDIIKKSREINLNYLQITLDGDERQHNQVRNENGKPSFSIILENCISYCIFSPQNRLLLRINYTDKVLKVDFTKVLDIIPIEIRPQINIQFQRVWQTYRNKEKNIPDLFQNIKGLKQMGFTVILSGFVLYRGSVCYADRINYANINYDGLVYRCTANNYTKENALGYLNDSGDIIWSNEKLKVIDKKANFENEKCLNCKYLPLCGGPCLNRRLQTEEGTLISCMKDDLDIDINSYIKDLYYKTKKRKIEKLYKV